MDRTLENNAFNWAKKNRKKIVKEKLLQYSDKKYKAKQIIFLSGSP